MTTAKFKPVEEQLAYLRKGVAEIIPEDEFKAKLEQSAKTGKPLRVYLGVDPTAPDLHLGHTVVLRKLKHFQDLGHTAIFLIGDFSAMIGDPTGQSETRPPLTREQVDANAKTYLEQVYKILDREKTEVRYNSEWLGKMSAEDVVRLCSHYQLARMLEREDFRKRLESGQEWELRRRKREALRFQTMGKQVPAGSSPPDVEARKTLAAAQSTGAHEAPQPISVHELLYPLLTAYDAVSLKSDVELGATEQKFNLLVHREIQREYGLPGQAILTMPILVGRDGQRKMSKSFGNYVGITEPPNEMFKNIMRIPDSLMWDYFKLLTDRTTDVIENLQKNVQAGTTHPKQVKVSLASEIVRDFYGEEATLKAAANWQQEVGLGLVPDDAPVKNLPEDNYIGSKPGKMKLSRALLRLDAAPSRAEAERLIKQGAVELDDCVITDPTYEIDLTTPRKHLLRVGKKKVFYFIVQG
jgi:tyrosyl-tRNA synthetase